MSAPSTAAPRTGTYTPGYARAKVLMILFGLLLFATGLWQLATPLRLMLFGDRARAEAVWVIKTKVGLPDRVLRTDAQLQAGLESRDRSYVFWNEFRFHAADGRAVSVRAPVGSELKPLYPLLDADGLPTSDTVWYDPREPQTVVFPEIVSTWFAGGMLLLIGLMAVVIGAVLLYWADKPITLPHIPAPSGDKP